MLFIVAAHVLYMLSQSFMYKAALSVSFLYHRLIWGKMINDFFFFFFCVLFTFYF